MEKGSLPPSYDDVFRSQNPSAPMMEENSPSHHASGNAPGWNQISHQQRQYSAHPTQPTMQNQTVHHQMTAPPPVQTVVIINQQIQLGENPVCMICPHCKQQTITHVEFVNNWMVHLIAGIFCFMCWIPCAILPYCCSSMKDATHTCKKCNGYIGTYRRTSRRR